MDHIQVSLRRLNDPLLLLALFLGAVALFSVYALQPVPTNVYGDFIDGSYWQAMDALTGGHVEDYFLPNRLTTGMGLLLFVIGVGELLGSRELAWMLLSVLAYVGTGLVFFLLAERILKNTVAAVLSTVIVALNYGAIVWGLNYTADGMGWFFFVAALYFAYRFFDHGSEKWLWSAIAMVAIGGIFKEYALCAYIGIGWVLLLKDGYSFPKKIALILGGGLLALVPFMLANAYSWVYFHYTYLDWWHYNHTNQVTYLDSYVEEYIKILGGIYNFAWFLFLPGLVLFWKMRKELMTNHSLQFIIIAALASLPVFIWPPFQRIFFITVPAFALVAGLFIARMKRPWLAVPLLAAYVVCAFLMDAVILPTVNIRPLLNAIFG